MGYGGFEMGFFWYAGYEFQKVGGKSGMRDWEPPPCRAPTRIHPIYLDFLYLITKRSTFQFWCQKKKIFFGLLKKKIFSRNTVTSPVCDSRYLTPRVAWNSASEFKSKITAVILLLNSDALFQATLGVRYLESQTGDVTVFLENIFFFKRPKNIFFFWHQNWNVDLFVMRYKKSKYIGWILVGALQGGGSQSRIPLFPPTFWNSYPAYQKNPISNPPYPIAFPNLQIPHTKKFNDKILHTKKNERQILLSRFLFWPQNFL